VREKTKDGQKKKKKTQGRPMMAEKRRFYIWEKKTMGEKEKKKENQKRVLGEGAYQGTQKSQNSPKKMVKKKSKWTEETSGGTGQGKKTSGGGKKSKKPAEGTTPIRECKKKGGGGALSGGISEGPGGRGNIWPTIGVSTVRGPPGWVSKTGRGLCYVWCPKKTEV